VDLLLVAGTSLVEALGGMAGALSINFFVISGPWFSLLSARYAGLLGGR